MSIFGEPRERKNPVKTMATDEEKRLIEQAAEALGMSVAELIRVAVNEYIARHTKRGKAR
ncbi:MAG: ribbon-helix-helix protein, CopG family [Phycisphaerales bacterium]|nr:ribbon-helix-helix protein, CopG family [Phycisphaerales bacterium]MCI0674205.1 ribbon-helix-helix protein, CopG family [Phycisphaerales bacterium]